MKYRDRVLRHRLQTIAIIAATVFASTIVLSSILYINFSGILREKIYASTKENLQQMSFSVRSLSDNVANISKQLVTDFELQPYLLSKDLTDLDVFRCATILESYRMANPIIDSIYLINSSNQILAVNDYASTQYSEQNFFDQEILISIQNGDKHPIARKVSYPTTMKGNIDSAVYTYIFKGNYRNQPSLHNTIVVNISVNWLDNLINDMDMRRASEKKTLIVNRGGQVVYSTTGQLNESVLEKAYFSQIMQSQESTGYFISRQEFEDVFTVYVWSDIYEWCFISNIPYEEIIGEIRSQRNITVAIGIGTVLIAIAFIVLLSGRINKPVALAYEAMDLTEKEHSRQLRQMKNTLLLSLLKGRLHKNNYPLIENYQSEGNTSVDFNASMLLFVMLVDHSSDSPGGAVAGEEDILHTAIRNAAEETLRQIKGIEVIDESASVFLVLGNCHKEEAGSYELQKEFRDDLLALQEQIYRECGASLSIAVSLVAHNYLDLPIYYDNCMKLRACRFVLGHQCIAFPHDLEYVNEAPDFSGLNHKAILEYTISGKIDEAKAAYNSMIGDIPPMPLEMYRHLLNQLYFDIRYAFKNKASSPDALDGQLSDYFSKLQNAETLADAQSLFHHLFESIDSCLEDERNNKRGKITEKTIAFIEAHYADSLLSATMIADNMNVSSAYLGTLFNKHTGSSIPKYINDVRMTKSKEMLISTKYSVNEIATACGFTNTSYFYSVFKRETGVTPNQFRTNREQNNGKQGM